jgi:hypothetical protein
MSNKWCVCPYLICHGILGRYGIEVMEPADYFFSSFLKNEGDNTISIVEMRVTLFVRSDTPSLHLSKNKVFVISEALLDQHLKRGRKDRIVITQS